MLRYKKLLIELITALKQLENNQSDFNFLLTLQLKIFKKICYFEKKIKILRKSDKLLNKNQIEVKIDNYKRLIYLIRTIADGIVFIYFDKWDIKRFSLENDTQYVKRDMGNISGKIGSRKEKFFLKKIIKKNIPAILNDITNVLRHGDICVPGLSEDGSIVPQSLEIKTSIHRNKRIARQMEAINRLNNYLITDKMTFGNNETRIRRDCYSDEINYVENINKIIELAYLSGAHVEKIEEGLAYLVVRDKKGITPELLDKIKMDKPMAFFATPAWEHWLSHYPFTLSIKKSEHLFDFMNMTLHILVFIDKEKIKSIFLKNGIQLDVKQNSLYILSNLRYTESKEQACIDKITDQFFYRTVHEFLSLEWFMQEIVGIESQIRKEIIKILPEEGN